jgi:hypothetical protein
LEEQPFNVRVRLAFFLEILVDSFPWMIREVAQAQILQRIDFTAIEQTSVEVYPILALLGNVFSHCQDQGIIISLWHQFSCANGREMIEHLAQAAEFPELAYKAHLTGALMGGLRIEELPNFGRGLLQSSDDEVAYPKSILWCALTTREPRFVQSGEHPDAQGYRGLHGEDTQRAQIRATYGERLE